MAIQAIASNAGASTFTVPPPDAKRHKSLRPLFDELTNASTHLDDMLAAVNLSKEETESLIASEKFHIHRKLRTQLLAQQLQLVAQDHAQSAIKTLVNLTDSNHAAIARLAATQILQYAGLNPPKPTASTPWEQTAPTTQQTSEIAIPSQSATAPKTKSPFFSILASILVAGVMFFPFIHRKGIPDTAYSTDVGRWQNPQGSTVADNALYQIADTNATSSPVTLKNLKLQKFQATFSVLPDPTYGGTVGLRFMFDVKGFNDWKCLEITHDSHQTVPGTLVMPNGGTWTGISSSTTNSSNVPVLASTDTLWVQVTSDGSTVSVKEATSQAGLSSASNCFSSSSFGVTGGRFGFGCFAGAAFVDNFTVKSWDAGTSSFDKTEAVENFTINGSNYGGDNTSNSDYSMLPQYDSNGNLLFDGLQVYTYDAWNRLVTVAHGYRDGTGSSDVHSGQRFVLMQYDALGRRTVKAIGNTSLGLVPTGIDDCTYNYYLNGNSVIEEQNGSGKTIKDHVWGLGYVDEAVQTRINTNPTSTPSWSNYYHLQDANFNDMGIVDSSGNLVERYEYSPYGQRQVFYSPGVNDPGCYASTMQSVKVVTSGSVTQPYGINEIGFQGLIDDEQTNLGYARNRYMNFLLGRWNSEEPFGSGYVDGPNLFLAYANDPIHKMDPFGLTSALAIPQEILDFLEFGGKILQTAQQFSVSPAYVARIALGAGILTSTMLLTADSATITAVAATATEQAKQLLQQAKDQLKNLDKALEQVTRQCPCPCVGTGIQLSVRLIKLFGPDTSWPKGASFYSSQYAAALDEKLNGAAKALDVINLKRGNNGLPDLTSAPNHLQEATELCQGIQNYLDKLTNCMAKEECTNISAAILQGAATAGRAGCALCKLLQ